MNKYITLMTLLCLGNNLQSAASAGAEQISPETMLEINMALLKNDVISFLKELSEWKRSGFSFRFCTQKNKVIVVRGKGEDMCWLDLPEKLVGFNHTELTSQLKAVFLKIRIANGENLEVGYFKHASFANDLDELIALIEKTSVLRIIGGPADREVILYGLRGILC